MTATVATNAANIQDLQSRVHLLETQLTALNLAIGKLATKSQLNSLDMVLQSMITEIDTKLVTLKATVDALRTSIEPRL